MTIKRTIALMLSLLMLLSLLPTALADSPHTHSWKEVSRVNPTCTKDGYAVYTCSCGARKTEPLPALGHKFSKKVYVSYADCEHYGVFYWVCERCGAHSENGNDKPLGHDWDEGKVTKAPTATEDGEMTYTCQRDPSHTKTEVIPAGTVISGVHPSFSASGSWAEDAGEDKRFDGALVQYVLSAENTGDCPLTFNTDFGNVLYVNGPSGTQVPGSKVTIDPGQSFEYGVLEKVMQDPHVKNGIFYNGKTLRAAYTDENGQEKDDVTQFVEIIFPLTYPDEIKPELVLSASWADDAGKGKRYEGAEVDVAFTVTNTGNCPVEWYYNAPQVISCTGPSGSLSANTHIEMQPSEHVTYIYRYTVAQSHVESGLLEVSQASWGWYTDKNGERTIVYSNTVFEEYIPLTYPDGEEPEHHPSLLLSIGCDGHVYVSSGSDIDHYEYAIKIDYTLKNTGDIPLKFRKPSYYASVEEYAVLDPEGAFDSHFAWTIKYDTGSSTGGFDDIVYTSEDPKYIGYFDFSLQIPGYDVDDKDPGPGTELCVSNEDSLRVWIKNPDYIEEDGPESGNADFCSLATTGVSDTSVSYNLHTCYKHLETAEAAEKLSLAGDWAGAAELWRAKIEELYAEMAEKAGEVLADALNEDKEAFFEYADAVQALFGDEEAAELLRLRCAEMCCMLSTLPEKLPSSLSSAYIIPDTLKTFDASSREIGTLNGRNSLVSEHYAGPAAEALAGTKRLLDLDGAVQADAVFAECISHWKSAAEEMMNSAYRASDKNARTLISVWSMSLSYLRETDEELYTLLYSAYPAVVDEHIMELYKDAALLLAEAE